MSERSTCELRPAHNVNNVSNVNKTTSPDSTISHEHEMQTLEREHYANNNYSIVYPSASERETLTPV